MAPLPARSSRDSSPLFRSSSSSKGSGPFLFSPPPFSASCTLCCSPGAEYALASAQLKVKITQRTGGNGPRFLKHVKEGHFTERRTRKFTTPADGNTHFEGTHDGPAPERLPCSPGCRKSCWRKRGERERAPALTETPGELSLSPLLARDGERESALGLDFFFLAPPPNRGAIHGSTTTPSPAALRTKSSNGGIKCFFLRLLQIFFFAR